ncbi:Gcd10p-domain-containing protein [Xylona heveae TC161]|uniref:tRNA (adenine(58)-N(1))-methyltransferase non-catalytic subunit TRM6 n=1 Tax=Xylona heveae (strain CBS 132557 / TC161) TaxID=1328760 RepID=A0A165AIS8_XYLHT|nr:Gcd10p-domain-containing protein [Xylona heveae TC161]KZF20550.1 Gcd10p-domain-containing protein [Xylona heveae TC161]
MHSSIKPYSYLALRLPSETLKIVQLVPNAVISIGKYGTFQANHLLGRPYNLTYEIVDDIKSQQHGGLRVVPASELHAEVLADGTATPTVEGEEDRPETGEEYEVVGEDGEVIMRTNRQTIDDPTSQKMTFEEIEALKKEGSGAGKDLIAKLLSSHSAIDQKTAFSLAKYTLRKTRKYARRFTVLPLDIPLFTEWLLAEKEPMRSLDLRDELIGLIGSWANIRCSASEPQVLEDGISKVGGGRWLVVDETGGLIVAAMAERLGILYPPEEDDSDSDSESEEPENPAPTTTAAATGNSASTTATQEAINDDVDMTAPEPAEAPSASAPASAPAPSRQPHHHHHHHPVPQSATRNTLTLLHANAQPNLSLLKYFLFDASTPSPSHPLHDHLKMLSWLQLLSPEDDNGYTEPERVPDDIIKTWKSGKRGTYFRKRRRWERIRAVVDETRAGGFDGLIVASVMNPVTILQHTLPLLRGAAQVVVYSPTVEPLTELADCFSTARRTAFVTMQAEATMDDQSISKDDFPINPTLLLAPSIQTSRVREYQVLPGRTHPLMTSRGNSEGYVFTGTRVLPAEGKVEARGKNKRRKLVGERSSETPA